MDVFSDESIVVGDNNALEEATATDPRRDSQIPEIEVIDGIRFLCWESEQQLDEYTKMEEKLKKRKETNVRNMNGIRAEKIIVPTKTNDITKIKGWRNKVFATGTVASVNGSEFQFSDSMTPYNNENYAPSVRPMSSALQNTVVANSAAKLNDELNLKNISNCTVKSTLDAIHTGSSPLKRKASSDFKDATVPNYKKTLLHCVDANICGESALQEKPKHRGPGRPKKIRPVEPVANLINFDPECITEEIIEKTYKHHITSSEIEQQNRKKFCNPSFTMDEQYVKFALSALAVQNSKDGDKGSTTNDVLSAVGLTPTVHKCDDSKSLRNDKDADVTKIISRHSKRDIRLPARYHQSGLLLGSQWVIPEIDTPEKCGKKRLQHEQKRLIKAHKLNSRSESEFFEVTEQFDQFDEISKFHEDHNFGLQSSNESRTSDPEATTSLLQKPKRIRHSGYSVQLKLHKQRLLQISHLKKKQELQSRRKLLENQELSQSKLHSSHPPQLTPNSPLPSQHSPVTQLPKPKTIADTIIERFKPKTADIQNPVMVPTVTSSLQGNTSNCISKEQKLSQLKELYRELYYENDPERRLIYTRKKTKPRVNKKGVVDEGLEVIKKLESKGKKLEYIKRLLVTWNKKLQICVKVLEKDHKGDCNSSPSQNVSQVVTDVLKAYQSSMCYKLSMALDNKRKELESMSDSKEHKKLKTKDENDVIVIETDDEKDNSVEVLEVSKSVVPHNNSTVVSVSQSSCVQKTAKKLSSSDVQKASDAAQLKPTPKPTVVRPTTFIINSPTNTTMSNSIALLPKGVPISNSQMKIASLVPNMKAPSNPRVNISQFHSPQTPVISRVVSSSDSLQRSILNPSSRPLSATICRPTTATATRPTAATSKPLIVTPSSPNIRHSSVTTKSVVGGNPVGTLNVATTTVRPTVTTGHTSGSGFMVKLSGNTVQVPLIHQPGPANSSNLILTYCLKENKLVPLSFKQMAASGIPVYKLTQKKYATTAIVPKLNNSTTSSSSNNTVKQSVSHDLTQAKI